MKTVLFIAFLALGPALADQTPILPPIAASTDAAAAAAADVDAPASDAVSRVTASPYERTLAGLCGRRS